MIKNITESDMTFQVETDNTFEIETSAFVFVFRSYLRFKTKT